MIRNIKKYLRRTTYERRKHTTSESDVACYDVHLLISGCKRNVNRTLRTHELSNKLFLPRRNAREERGIMYKNISIPSRVISSLRALDMFGCLKVALDRNFNWAKDQRHSVTRYITGQTNR